MRKYFQGIAAAVIFALPATAAPSKTPLPSGVGVYVIGKGLDVVLSGRSVPVISGIKTNQFPGGTYEIKGEVFDLDQIYITGNFCPDARVFYVRDYSVAGMTIDLELTFYQGKLIEISSGSALLANALIAKYGPGKEHVEEQIHTCSSSFGNIQARTIMASNRWENGDIVTEYLFKEVLNDKCQKDMSGGVTMVSTSTLPVYKACNQKFTRLEEDKANQQKKAKLQDL